jgi:GcrA cell cycle regulator
MLGCALPNHPDKWPDEIFLKVKKMWCDDGLSGSQIAERCASYGFTRSAIVSKMNRAGFKRDVVRRNCVAKSGPKSKPVAPAKPRHERAVNVLSTVMPPQLRGPTASKIPVAPSDVNLSVAPEDKNIPLFQRRTVDTLDSVERHECRWPCGDPAKADFFFCGAKALVGLPYCETHQRRAYVPVPPRRRDRAVSNVSVNKEFARVLEKEDALD